MLMQWVSSHGTSQLGNHLPVLTEGELRVEQRVASLLMLVKQPGGHLANRQVSQRRFAPQLKRANQQRGRATGIALVKGVPALTCQVKEVMQVKLTRGYLE